MASAPLASAFAGLEIDAVPDAPRDVIPEDEKETAVGRSCSPAIVSLHGASGGVSITEVTKEDESSPAKSKPSTPPAPNNTPENVGRRRSSGRLSSGQKIDLGRHFSQLQLPYAMPAAGSGGGNLVLVNQSNGVQVGDTYVYNTPTVASPTSVKPSASYKPKKIDAEEKFLQDLCSVSDRVSTEEISIISTHIGVNWRILGRRLMYSDGQLDQFYLNFEKLQMKEVVYQMLLDWKRTKTSKATIKSLAKHLYKSYEVDAMIELHKIKFGDQ